MQRIMSKLWVKTLNLEEEPGEDMSFFDLGGNSFLAATVCQDFEEETGLTIEITDFYEYETIRDLIELVNRKGEGVR